jgi:hypothetical protein
MSVPFLTAVPVINILANLIFCETVPLLDLAFELVPTAIYNVKIIVSELPPLLLDLPFIASNFPPPDSSPCAPPLIDPRHGPVGNM